MKTSSYCLVFARSRRCLMVAAVLALLSGISVSAANFTWDASGGAPLDDGAGTWDASGGSNWFDGSSYGAWGNTSADVAVFGVGSGAAGTITVGVGVVANGITFNAAGSGNYTLSTSGGNTITLQGATPTITTNVGGGATINTTLAGSAGLVKAGGGTLSILAEKTNLYTGGTTINTGKLTVQGSSSTGTVDRYDLSTGPVHVASGATLDIDGGNRDLSRFRFGTLSGEGTLIVRAGAGQRAVQLNNGAITSGYSTGFTGTVQITARGAYGGEFRVQNPFGAGSSISVGTHTALVLNNGSGTFPSDITLNGGDLAVDVGQLRLTNNSIDVTGKVVVAGNMTDAVEGHIGSTSGSGKISGVISEAGGSKLVRFTMSGNSSVILTGNNTWTGGTAVRTSRDHSNAGTLQVGNGGTSGTLGLAVPGHVGSGNLSLIKGSNASAGNPLVRFNRRDDVIFAGNISGLYGRIEQAGAGILTLGGTNTYGDSTVVSGGTLLVNGSHVGGGSYTVANGATLGGSGRIAPAGGATITANSGATIAPGASIGTLTVDLGGTTGGLTMNSGAKFAFEIAEDGSTPDQIAFWNYAGASDFVLNGNVIDVAVLGDPIGGYRQYTVSLFSFYSDGGDTPVDGGIVSGLTLGTLDPRIYSAALVFNGTTIDLVYAVPEPSSLNLLALAGLAVLRRRKRR